MKQYIKQIVPMAAMALSLGFSSCVGDLDVSPIDPNLDLAYDINGLFNKCYANIALAGNGGANGDCDIDGLDGGTTGFVRQMFNSNELTTDEAICGWGDDGIASFCYNTYDASHPMLKGYYARLTTGISYCNNYLSIASGHDATMTAEVRFVRALEYYLLMDAFGNVPFTTSLEKPGMKTRAEIFAWIEDELLKIEPALSEARPKVDSEPMYGRVDKAAAWMLLARLYLNSEVYTGTAQWDKAAAYAKKIMDSSYKLNTTGKNGYSAYQMLFMADNGETSAAQEDIFPILQDGLKTTSWGTSLFLIAGCWQEDMVADPAGVYTLNGTAEKWGGNRCRPELVKKFFPDGNVRFVNSIEMPREAGDDRAILWGQDRTLDNTEVTTFSNGFSVAKFTNYRCDGQATHDATFPDADFMFFRAAEAYLIYAEATARQNGGTLTVDGIAAVNALRDRANAKRIDASFTLRDLCDEWSREFYFEGIRRPTLIRFGLYNTNDYLWQWKGGAYAGRAFSAERNVFAIPSAEVAANSNMVQNPGY